MPPCRGVFDGIPLAQAGPEAGSRSLRKEARPPASPLRSLFCVWRLKSFRPAPLALRPVARGEAPFDPPAAGFRGGSPRYAAGGVRLSRSGRPLPTPFEVTSRHRASFDALKHLSRWSLGGGPPACGGGTRWRPSGAPPTPRLSFRAGLDLLARHSRPRSDPPRARGLSRGNAELRATLLQEHVWRQREGV